MQNKTVSIIILTTGAVGLTWHNFITPQDVK